MNVKDIISKAVSLGACSNSAKATDWRSLVWLFFSPQGREFCKESGYPTLGMFREIAKNVEPYGVYVEKGVEKSNEDVALIGEAESVLHYSGTDKAYKVILMHGAKAVIHASGYAVVRLENISGKYEIINDGTAEVLV